MTEKVTALQHVFEVAEDAVHCAVLRRQAYALGGDGFSPITAVA